MTQYFNRSDGRDRRRYLRSNPTLAEKALWYSIRKSRVSDTRFQRQFGVAQYSIDFACRELRLAIEVDGASHDSELQQQKDEARQYFIEQFGLRFIRVSDDEILNRCDAFIEVLKAEIDERREELATKPFRGRPPRTPPRPSPL